MANTRREYKYKGLFSDIHIWQVSEPGGLDTYYYRLADEELSRVSAYEKLKAMGFTDKEMASFTNPEFTKGTTNFVVEIPDFSTMLDQVK